MRTSLGLFKAGPEISYKYELSDGTMLEPRLGLQAIWNFSRSDRVADFGGRLTGPEELPGRVELGLRANAPSGVGLDLPGSYDDIGSDIFHSIGGKATLRIPLN